MLKEFKFIDKIIKNQDDISYVLYDCNNKKIIGKHNFYNNYYSASIWKPIIILIYIKKYGINSIPESELDKILSESNNKYYIKYGRKITKKDEDDFFKKYYNSKNNFKINIIDHDFIANKDPEKEYNNYIKLNYKEKLKVIDKLLINYYIENLNDKNISNEDCYYQLYFNTNIKCINFKKGYINTNEDDFSKVNTLLLAQVYKDFFHEEKFGPECKILKKYMKNIKTSRLIPAQIQLDFYHKTGSQYFFKNEILYFNIKNINYILAFISKPSYKNIFGINYDDYVHIVLSLIRGYIIDKKKIHENIESIVPVKYFSSYQIYPLQKIIIQGKHKIYSLGKRIESTETIIEIDQNKNLKVNNNFMGNSIYIIHQEILELKTLYTRTGQIENHKINSSFNLYNTGTIIKIFLDVKLTNYITGVVYHESMSTWMKNIDFVKSFALIAKNYMIFQCLNNKMILNNATFQVYKYHNNNTIKNIVKETINTYIMNDNNTLVLTLFSSSCGGKTFNYFYNNNLCKGITDKFKFKFKDNCSISPYNIWSYNIEQNIFDEKINNKNFYFKQLSTIKYDYNKKDGFMDYIIFINKTNNILKLSNREFVKMFEWYNIKSTIFNLTLKKNCIIVNGKGRGHSYGFCQWGGYSLSSNMKFQEIIQYYFKNCNLTELNIK